jgi:hypothetical protein
MLRFCSADVAGQKRRGMLRFWKRHRVLAFLTTMETPWGLAFLTKILNWPWSPPTHCHPPLTTHSLLSHWSPPSSSHFSPLSPSLKTPSNPYKSIVLVRGSGVISVPRGNLLHLTKFYWLDLSIWMVLFMWILTLVLNIVP